MRCRQKLSLSASATSFLHAEQNKKSGTFKLALLTLASDSCAAANRGQLVRPAWERDIPPLTVQQRRGNAVHAQCTDFFRAVLTSRAAVLPVRYELNLMYYLREFPTVLFVLWAVCDGRGRRWKRRLICGSFKHERDDLDTTVSLHSPQFDKHTGKHVTVVTSINCAIAICSSSAKCFLALSILQHTGLVAKTKKYHSN